MEGHAAQQHGLDFGDRNAGDDQLYRVAQPVRAAPGGIAGPVCPSGTGLAESIGHAVATMEYAGRVPVGRPIPCGKLTESDDRRIRAAGGDSGTGYGGGERRAGRRRRSALGRARPGRALRRSDCPGRSGPASLGFRKSGQPDRLLRHLLAVRRRSRAGHRRRLGLRRVPGGCRARFSAGFGHGSRADRRAGWNGPQERRWRTLAPAMGSQGGGAEQRAD